MSCQTPQKELEQYSVSTFEKVANVRNTAEEFAVESWSRKQMHKEDFQGLNTDFRVGHLVGHEVSEIIHDSKTSQDVCSLPHYTAIIQLLNKHQVVKLIGGEQLRQNPDNVSRSFS